MKKYVKQKTQFDWIKRIHLHFQMSFLTGTHRFLDPKCNEVLDQFYECIKSKTRALGACDSILAELYRCKKEDVSRY